MYIDIADMTLEEVSRISQALSTSRLAAYLQKVGEHAYLYAVEERDYKGVHEPMLSEM